MKDVCPSSCVFFLSPFPRYCEKEIVSIEEQIEYWIRSADNDLAVADHLFQSSDYSWCLFVGHLVLEKILKALYVKSNKKIPPRTHNLLTLSKSIDLDLAPEQEEFLSRVNDFNIEARYPDFEMQFAELCTKEFTLENLSRIKDLYRWLKSLVE